MDYFIIQIIFVLNVSMLTLNISGNNLRSRILPYLDTLCPNAKMCTEFRPDFVQAEIDRVDGFPCCQDCSCADDCQTYGDCCFPRTMIHSCVATLILGPKASRPRFIPHHYMVTQPPSSGCFKNMDSQNNHIEVGSTPWDKMFPIVSSITKQTYINRSIAECHNVLDGVPWNLKMTCSNVTGKELTDTFFESSPECSFEFEYPGDRKEVDRIRCQKTHIYVCGNNHAFSQKTNLTLSTAEITSLCKSDFFAPARGMYATYKNVFCQMCNDAFDPNDLECEKEWTILQQNDNGPITIPQFTVLLNHKFVLNPSRSESVIRNEKEQFACPTTLFNKEECRPLYCSTFQLKSENGSCISRWDSIGNTSYNMTLKLLPETTIPLDEWFIQNEDPNNWFNSSWNLPWHIVLLYLDKTQSNDSYIYVVINAITNGDVTELLNNISRNIKKPWRVPFGNGFIHLRQQIDGFYFSTYKDLTRVDDERRMVITKALEPIFMKHQSQAKRDYWEISLTKLHLCQQVNLETHEYIMINDTLLYNKTKTYFLKNEYRNVPKEGGEFVIRICLEDSGLIALNSRASMELSVDYELVRWSFYAVSFCIKIFYH